jgi:acetyl esterase/lipase
MLVMAFFSFLTFNYMPILGIPLLILIVILMFFEFKSSNKKIRIPLLILSIIMVILMLFSKYYLLRNIPIIILILILLGELILDMMENKNKNFIMKCGYVFIYFLSTICLFVFSVCVFSPDTISLIAQRDDAKYPLATEKMSKFNDNVILYSDVTYDSKYPNNTYSVYVTKENKGTFFYIHGGGLIVGDKNTYTQNMYLHQLVLAGFNVVTIDYALAPQHRNPISLIQVNEALKHFVKEALSKYGIDPNKIVVGGDSAGAYLSGQLANLQTNEEYAKKLGIIPALSGTNIKLCGFVSISGLLDISRYADTGNIFYDWIFDVWGRSAFDECDYMISDTAKTYSLLHNVTSSFPASYISDGNSCSFSLQGKDFVLELEGLGISVTSYFPDKSNGILRHDFELNVLANPYAAKNMEMTLEWLENIFK